jgi:hypothetical protein
MKPIKILARIESDQLTGISLIPLSDIPTGYKEYVIRSLADEEDRSKALVVLLDFAACVIASDGDVFPVGENVDNALQTAEAARKELAGEAK